MTKIEWTKRPGTKGETWNPIRARNNATGGTGHFCTKVSAGCQNCYAADFQKRFKNPVRYAAQDADQVDIFLDETVLMQPLRWKKPRTIFVCSMTDLFYDGHEWDWWGKILGIAALCPQHTFIILTKRPDAAYEYLEEYAPSHVAEHASDLVPLNTDISNIGLSLTVGVGWQLKSWPLPNVWLGVSVEDQATAIERIPRLLETPAAVRFISAEPLLGPVELDNLIIANVPTGEWSFNCLDNEGLDIEDDEAFKGATIDWVICGGESGHNARPMHPDWARSLRDQCKAAGVPFFFKQWGAWKDCSHLEFPGVKGASADHIFLPSGEVLGVGVRKHGLGYVELDWKERGGAWMCNVGKKRAGRLLDGVEHNAFPTAAVNENRTAESELVRSGNYAA